MRLISTILHPFNCFNASKIKSKYIPCYVSRLYNRSDIHFQGTYLYVAQERHLSSIWWKAILHTFSQGTLPLPARSPQ